MGGPGSWRVLSCSATHLLILERRRFWNSAEQRFFPPSFFLGSVCSLRIPTQLLRPGASSAAGNVNVCPHWEGSGQREWAEKKGRTYQQGTWSVVKEALSEATGKTVYSIQNYCGNEQSQRSWVFRSVSWWGQLRHRNINMNSAYGCIWLHFLPLCVDILQMCMYIDWCAWLIFESVILCFFSQVISWL